MSSGDFFPYQSSIEQYQQAAQALFDGLRSGDDAAAWRFKWLHPRFRGRSVKEVNAAVLDFADAQLVVAHEHAFETWSDLVGFTDVIRRGGSVARFEAAVEGLVLGDVATLRRLLIANPELTTARSSRRHYATLLHYAAANGVEGYRQKTPANAIDVVRVLLDAGAEVDALADMYDVKCTTMSLLVSSCHPANAGLQSALAETLLNYGAALDGPGSKWESPLMTALTFGYLSTAEVLARRGARVDTIVAVAGLGRAEDTARMLPVSDSHGRRIALSLAAQLGHAHVVRLLLDAGEDPDRYNSDEVHPHSTPLHQAVCSGHENVVRLLVERGARLDMRDTIYGSTPLGWAIHCEKLAIADYLRERGAMTS